MGRSIPVLERLFQKTVLDTNGPGCWLWVAKIGSGGYGVLWFDGKNRYAHRVSYELFVGEIPDGLQLDHLCRVRNCVNPAHLEPVTHRVNQLRGNGFAAKNMAKTHCLRGHELSGDNLIRQKRTAGFRVCRRCRNEVYSKRRYSA